MHSNAITGASFVRNDELIVTASTDSIVNLLDPTTYEVWNPIYLNPNLSPNSNPEPNQNPQSYPNPSILILRRCVRSHVMAELWRSIVLSVQAEY